MSRNHAGSAKVHRLGEAVRHHDGRAPILADPFEDRCRIVGRIWSAVSILVFLGLVIRLGVPGAGKYVPWQSTASVLALSCAAGGLLLAYRWEALGGAIALVGGIALGVLAVVEYHPTVALLGALVFVTPAVLFLLAWRRTRTLRSVVLLGFVVAAVLAAGGVAAWGFYDRGFGATHPASAAPVLPDSAVTWIWAGGVTADRAVVVAEVPDADDVQLMVTRADARSPALDAGRRISGTESDGVYRFVLAGLEPATEYRYEIVADGAADVVRNGTLTTFGLSPQSITIAVGSCARLGSNGAVYDAIAAVAPDLFVVPGDFFYGDILANSDDAFRSAYRETLSRPGQAALYRTVPIAYIWDDHDYGPNNAGADSPSREAALASYRALVPHYDLAIAGDDAPIAQAFTIGRVRFLMTDLRSARSPAAAADGPDKSMLGHPQRMWLEEELAEAAARGELVVWVSSVAWIGAETEGADDWPGYPTERRALASFIADHDVEVLMLAGDAHMVAIDDGSNSGYAGPGSGFPMMHAGALDRPGSLKGGPYSEGAFPAGGQFGTIEIVDDGGSEVAATLTGWDWTGAPLTTLTTTFELGDPP